jgi:hypothetical protein
MNGPQGWHGARAQGNIMISLPTELNLLADDTSVLTVKDHCRRSNPLLADSNFNNYSAESMRLHEPVLSQGRPAI